MPPLKRLVIHCTDTPAGREVTADDIRHWHLDPPPKGRGWAVVGYSDMVHLNGHIEKLRDYNEDSEVQGWEITNGAAGYNSTSRHIVYVGGRRNNRPADTRTNDQIISLRFYIKLFQTLHKGCEVIGHHDLNPAKDCPCFDVRAWVAI
jgi:N-acetylmuramoyl-L-alanine amidase